MARSNTITKKKNLQTELKANVNSHPDKDNVGNDNILAVPAIRETNANRACLLLVEKVFRSAKTLKQSQEQFEKDIEEASVACLQYAHEHNNDARPMDRLVKGLLAMKHPTFTQFAREVVAWARLNSPIRFKADGSVTVLSEGDEGFKDYNQEQAIETPFYATAPATRARENADKSHKRSLEPYTYKDMMNRARGLIRTFYQAQRPDRNGDVRGIVKKDIPKIKTMLDKLSTAIGIDLDEIKEEVEGKKEAA